MADNESVGFVGIEAYRPATFHVPDKVSAAEDFIDVRFCSQFADLVDDFGHRWLGGSIARCRKLNWQCVQTTRKQLGKTIESLSRS